MNIVWYMIMDLMRWSKQHTLVTWKSGLISYLNWLHVINTRGNWSQNVSSGLTVSMHIVLVNRKCSVIHQSSRSISLFATTFEFQCHLEDSGMRIFTLMQHDSVCIHQIVAWSANFEADTFPETMCQHFAFLQTYSNAFSCFKILVILFKFQWNHFPMIHWTICQHLFR